MGRLTSDEEMRKRAIFESMSPKRQKKILERGYDQWDPFVPPRDPVDLRRDRTQKTAAMLVKEFLSACPQERYSPAYAQGAWDICVGIISENDRYRAMFEFCCWYQERLRGAGFEGSGGEDDG